MKQQNLLKSQKGAVFLLTAFMIPLLLACAGLAVDLSNMYAMHSRLQNLADASAVAGARNFNLSEHPETVSDHPYADSMAEKFLQLNYSRRSEIEMTPPQVRQGADNYFYYRVHLKQDAPYYVLRYFRSVLGDSIKIDAIAYARIVGDASSPSGGNGGDNSGSTGSDGGNSGFKYFNNLFAIAGNMLGLNSTQNPDIFQRYDLTTAEGVQKAKSENQRMEMSSFYDGDILLAGSLTTNSFLFNNAAKEKYGQNGNGLDALNESLTGYITKPTYDPTLNKAAISGFISEAQKIAAANTTFQGDPNGSQSFNISNLNTNGAAYNGYRYRNTNGGDFQVTTALNGKSSDPYYVIVDNAAAPKIQMSSNVDTNRPIIYCYLGTSELWVTGAANSTFRGIIYAPNASKVSINDNGWNFYGSIVANNLDLQAKGTYNHADYLGNGGSSPGTPGTGSTDPSGNPKREVHLISQPSGITWDED